MTKEDMIQVLRSVGVNENTVTAMSNAFDMGAEYMREKCATVCEEEANDEVEGDAWRGCGIFLANNIRNRGDL
jgi:hypothetical protein